MSHPFDIQEVHRISGLEFLARQVVEGFITGLHKSPFHGFSVEFAEHRIYNSGESTRHIDWKLFGRTDKLFVKRYEEETNLRCQIVIDRSPSMYYPEKSTSGKLPPNKVSFAAYAAAAFVYMLKKQRDAVGLTVFADAIESQTPAKSSVAHQKLIFGQLEKLLQSWKPEMKGKTSAVEALHRVAESVHKRSLIVVFTDLFDSGKNNKDLLSALQHLRHNKHEVILFHVSDHRHELDFEFGKGLYTFVDMESGEEIRLFPEQLKEQFKKESKEYFDAFKLACGQYKIDFVEADINKGFDQVLLPFLLKRGKMI